MITAVFTDNDDYSHAYGLWQWDYGQQLRIEGLHLPTAVEIHFALQETGGEAITRVGTTKDGVTTVTIPDSVLEGNRATWTADKAYNIYAWVYLSDKLSGETIKRITMQVKSRPKPEAFETPEDGEIFREAIEAVNDAAKRAEEAGDKAIAAADEAKAAATQTAEHLQATEGLAEQVETNADTVAQDKQAVAGMLSQAQQAAPDAALSAQAAKLSETAAAQAQTGAEAAEDGARQYAEETGADRQAVANDKQAVGEMREAVAEDRQAVEQTTTQFGQIAQDALTAIGQAQSTAVGAVKAEGNKQTTAVQEAGTQAVKDVTTEGDKQTKRVEDAAANLADGVMDLAPAIRNTASGSVISADDATEGRPFRGLRIFGKSTQVRTTGAQLFDTKTCLKSQIEKGIVSINSDGKIVLNGKFGGDNRAFTVTLQPGTYTLSADKPSIWHIIAPVDGVFNQKITVDVETTYNCYIASGTYDNVETTPMINAGASALPWETYTGGKPSPSPEYPQEIVSAGEGGSIMVEVDGRNLLTGRLYFTNYSNNASYIYNEDEVTLPYTPPSETRGIGYVIPCKPGVQYTFSVTNPNKNWHLGIAEYENFEQAKSFLNKIGYQYGSEKSSIKYTAVGSGVLVCAIVGKWTDGKTSIHECTESELLQLEIGSEATTYEPPRIPQTLTLQTPNGLPGVPVSKDGNYTDENGQQWVCDEVDLERGKYVQRTIKITVDKETNLSANPLEKTKELRFYCSDLGVMSKPDIHSNTTSLVSAFCEHFKFQNIPTWNIDTVGIIAYAAVNCTQLSFRVPIDAGSDYFVNYPTTILAARERPIERDLTPEEIAAYKSLRTYGPTTVVSNDAGAGMEVTYVADTKSYIQNLEERLNAKLVNIQSALISQKISGWWGGGIKVTDSSRVPVVRFAMWGKTEQVRTSGKNLFDISSLKKYEINNNNLKASVVDGKIILEGKGVTTKEVIFFCLNKTDDLLKLNPGKYTLSFKSNMPTGTAHESKTVEAFAIIKKADGSSDYSSTGNKGWTTFDIAEGDMMYLRFDINNGTMSAEFYDIQLEYGSSATAYEPYSGNFPSPSPDWEQPIEITDQPVTVTVKGGTEQQSITLSPPKPMTKWDKLEKVDGVWCWVYQSRWVESYTDENITGEYISTTGELSAGADVYYRTDTPESIPLSPSEQDKLNTLTMYAPETEITNTGGCNMELTYTVDTKSYIDKKIAEISTAVLEV